MENIHQCKELKEAVVGIAALSGFIAKRTKNGVGVDDAAALVKELFFDKEFQNKLIIAVKGIQNVPSELKNEISQDGVDGLVQEILTLGSSGIKEFMVEFKKS